EEVERWIRREGGLLHGVLREASLYNTRRARSTSEGRRGLAAPRRCQDRLSVAEVLELRVDPELVLLSAHQLHDRLQVVPGLARHAHAVALDGALHLELRVLDQLDDRLRLFRLDSLREGDRLLDRLSALLDRAVLHAAQAHAALRELLHEDLAGGLQALLGRAADLDPLFL